MSLGYLLAFVAAVLWGLTYCLDERILASISIPKLYFLHSLCGVLVSAGILVSQGNSLAGMFHVDRGAVPLLAVTLVTATAAAFAILGSIQALGAGTSAILEISYPLFVALFSVLLFKGQLELPIILGGVFIFIGSAIIVMAG